ncbi:MAG: DUF2953 domain-containing protein [Bacillota bacterium]|jgi:hypothetical protein
MGTSFIYLSLGFLTLAGIVWLFPLECQVTYWKDWNRTEVTVTMGLVKRSKRLGSKSFTWHWISEKEEVSAKVDQAMTPKDGSKYGSPIDLPEIRLIMQQVSEYTKRGTELVGRTKIKQFCWVTELGLVNPMETALATGVLWGVKGWLISSIKRRFKQNFKSYRVKVIPNFQRQGLRIELFWQFESQLGYILLVAFKMLQFYLIKRYRKVRVGVRLFRHR